ncbi:hypothetical protein [Actinoplanes palleronii]|uniref:Lipoprotein n=1 Tax=Actinoplanes palleronii TaxID=113570 RepID=A0ABQ4B177_9ACTN|nr:hypothetical protein [Actinoplanes palleronii]GIE64317.1 hypothetical protein Apa02nite_004250 [Actinoplanes palleronii]
MAQRNVRRPARTGLVPLVVAGVLTLSACSAGASSGNPAPAAPATAPTSTTTAPTGTATGSVTGTPSSSGTAGADGTALADGKHDAYLTKVDTSKRTITFDKVEMLTGEAARKKYQEQNPGETDGPPNDYVLVNDNKLKRTLPVSGSVSVSVIKAGSGDSVNPVPSSFAKLPGYLADKDNSTLFALTVKGGEIVSLTSIYLP